MADEQDSRNITYGFEIQHVLTRGTFKVPGVEALLERAGLSLDMEGNKKVREREGALVCFSLNR